MMRPSSNFTTQTNVSRYLTLGGLTLVHIHTVAINSAYDGESHTLRTTWANAATQSPDCFVEAESFELALARLQDDPVVFEKAVRDSPFELAQSLAVAYDLGRVIHDHQL